MKAPIGEQEVWIAHIAKEDAPVVMLHRKEFNELVRYYGGMPVTNDDPVFAATVAFTSRQFRDDFVYGMKLKTGVAVVTDSRGAYVDRKELPPWLK